MLFVVQAYLLQSEQPEMTKPVPRHPVKALKEISYFSLKTWTMEQNSHFSPTEGLSCEDKYRALYGSGRTCGVQQQNFTHE